MSASPGCMAAARTRKTLAVFRLLLRCPGRPRRPDNSKHGVNFPSSRGKATSPGCGVALWCGVETGPFAQGCHQTRTPLHRSHAQTQWSSSWPRKLVSLAKNNSCRINPGAEATSGPLDPLSVRPKAQGRVQAVCALTRIQLWNLL